MEMEGTTPRELNSGDGGETNEFVEGLHLHKLYHESKSTSSPGAAVQVENGKESDDDETAARILDILREVRQRLHKEGGLSQLSLEFPIQEHNAVCRPLYQPPQINNFHF